ncbi:MFS transporter [Streptomyces radicis]|uniref:MFS transporter n=1 Tax=Streptomyces radicis TaxID=1750517 RepID=A0A3A9W765_9ACTN|nr:MFS transporter [Streptomyces radicis]RKN08710.1 MFS transporter [Streptomyces radicis]RKN21868.1 MFS transporter [Streptomyces radicis]
MTDTEDQAGDRAGARAGDGAAGARERGFGAPFWKLWSATTVTNLGQGATGIAFPWLATELTTDAFLVALMGLALRLPWLVFSLPAGVLADRLDRRRVLLAMSLARAAVVGTVGLLVAFDAMTLPLLYACALALGFAEVLFDNTAQVLLPSVVSRERLSEANGRLMAAQIVSDDFLAGPLGGVLIGLALAVPFAFDAGTALVAAVLLLTLRGTFRARSAPADNGADADNGAAAPARRSMRAEIAEGVRWLWRNPVLRRLAIALALFNAGGAGVAAIYVLYAQEVLGLGALGFALLVSAGGVGGFLGGMLAGRVTRRIGATGSLLMLCALDLVAHVVAGFASNAWLVGTVMGATGFGVVLWNVTTVSLRQTIIPDHLLGRVNSVYRLLGWGAMPLGILALGGLVALVEAQVSREAALRAPFFAVALISVGLAFYIHRHLHARALAEALEGTQPAQPEGS